MRLRGEETVARMLLAIYEKSQINQTNNENTPTKRRLGKKEMAEKGAEELDSCLDGGRKGAGHGRMVGWLVRQQTSCENLCKVFLMKRFTMAILKISKN